jgi:hypothetical protein
MVDQYKLRLGDGTVLAVDEQGLRTWLLDGKAMVQRPGSKAWRPLKEIVAALAEESAAAARRPPAPPVAPPPPTVAAATPVPLPLVPPPASPPARVVTAPLADSIAKPGAKLDDGIPIIPFKRLDDDEAPRPAAVPSGDLRDVAAAALDPEGRNEGPWQWPARTPGSDVARGDIPMAAPKISPSTGDVPGRSTHNTSGKQGPVDPRSIVYPPVPGEAAVRTAFAWGAKLLARGRDQLAQLPPPPVSRLDQALASPETRRRVKRGLVLAVSIAAVVASGVSLWVWSAQFRAGRPRSDKAANLPPAPLPAAQAPELPKEVQEAMAQLPHLSPETIQLVMASGHGPVTDPPEVFRRAYVAATRGTSALTDDEARELRTLMSGVLAALRRVDRDRVRAYGRLSSQRDLLVEEDRKVLSLFARGVRALSAERRQRLQDLSGKAIAAALPARAPAAGAHAVP